MSLITGPGSLNYYHNQMPVRIRRISAFPPGMICYMLPMR